MSNTYSGDAVFWCSFLAGLTSGSVASFFVTPMDVIKTRLQVLKRAEGERTYTGIVDVAL